MADELASKIVAAKSTKRATKELIYEHALRLFATRSYARTGLRDIAQAVGVEVASLYTHISGKNALLFDLMDYGTRDLLQRLTTVTERVAPDPLARLYVLMREHVAVNCRRQNQTLVAFNEIRELNAEQRSKIMPLREAIESLYIRALTDGIAESRMREVDVPVTVYGIVSMGRGVATWYRADGPLTPEQVGDEYADLVLRSVLTAETLARFGDTPIDLGQLTDAVPDAAS